MIVVVVELLKAKARNTKACWLLVDCRLTGFSLMSDSKTASELSELRQLPTQQQSRSGDLSSFVRLLCVVLCNQLKLSTVATTSMNVVCLGEIRK